MQPVTLPELKTLWCICRLYSEWAVEVCLMILGQIPLLIQLLLSSLCTLLDLQVIFRDSGLFSFLYDTSSVQLSHDVGLYISSLPSFPLSFFPSPSFLSPLLSPSPLPPPPPHPPSFPFSSLSPSTSQPGSQDLLKAECVSWTCIHIESSVVVVTMGNQDSMYLVYM